MFKRLTSFLLAAVFMATLVLATAASASAEPVAVIVNSSNEILELDISSINKIYSNDILRWPDGTPIIIYDLSVDNPLRDLFSRRVLGSKPERVAAVWASRKITNKAVNPPVTIKRQEHILREVVSNKGAIGYVSLSAASSNPDIRIVHIIE